MDQGKRCCNIAGPSLTTLPPSRSGRPAETFIYTICYRTRTCRLTRGLCCCLYCYTRRSTRTPIFHVPRQQQSRQYEAAQVRTGQNWFYKKKLKKAVYTHSTAFALLTFPMASTEAARVISGKLLEVPLKSRTGSYILPVPGIIKYEVPVTAVVPGTYRASTCGMITAAVLHLYCCTIHHSHSRRNLQWYSTFLCMIHCRRCRTLAGTCWGLGYLSLN